MGNTTFQYQVRDKTGKIVSGTLEAESQAAVAQKLTSMGYATVSISKASGGMKTELKIPGFGGKVKLKDLVDHVAPVRDDDQLRSLAAACTEHPVRADRRTRRSPRCSPRSATTSRPATRSPGRWRSTPRIFPPLMINMVRAGEVGGFLDGVLLQIAENYEAEVKLKGKIKSAMTYPVVVFVMAILAVTGMLLFIVPVFAKMFDGLGAPLPLPTQILVNLSRHPEGRCFPFLIVGLIVFIVVWREVKHKEQVRNFLDPLKLKMPVFGPLFQKIALSRFTRNFGTMLHAGVPILQSLDIVADTSGNSGGRQGRPRRPGERPKR